MVDASVGGKTGVNNRFGKNLIGAFYQPKGVYIDPAFLKTLPPREFAAGVAEIVKMAVMFDRDFFQRLERGELKTPDDLAYAIRRSVELKAEVVSQDAKERGVRAVLNYGHTFAHVIELETGFETYLHGECVAIGMVMANHLAVALGLLGPDEAQRIKALLEHYGLPTIYRIEDAEAFYQHFFHDKKSMDNAITFILPDHLGGYVMRNDISKETVMATLEAFGPKGRA